MLARSTSYTQASDLSGSDISAQPQDLAQAWNDLISDPEIQFAPVTLPEAEETPDWLIALYEFLAAIFGPVLQFAARNWAVIWPILGAMGVALVFYILWRIFGPSILARKKAAINAVEEEEWVPETEAAIALLKDADQLAADGRYDEATHLLLDRSVAHINQARPDLIEPSSTAREIAEFSALPENARTAFGAIANRVERSLFALRELGLDDWTAARAAYAEFAKLGTNVVAPSPEQPIDGAHS